MFLLGTLLTANAQVPSYVPKDSLKGWWSFTGNANDASIYKNHGSVNGATLTTDRFGNSNSAYSFDGVNDDINLGVNSQINKLNNLFTISFFLLKKDLNSSMIIGNIDSSIVGNGWRFNIRTTTILEASIRNSANWYPSYSTSNSISQNNWIHIVCVRNNTIMKIYLNGILNSTTNIGTVSPNNNPNAVTKLGKQWVNVNPNFESLNGKLDDLAIWNRALTQQEVENLYNSCDLISVEPTNQSSNINAQAQFNVVLNDTTANYQWQSNQSSLGWVNVPANSVYSGVAVKRLKISNVQVNNHKQLFRVIASKNTCKDTSVVAMLTVNDTCITSTTDTLYIKVNTSSLSNPIYNTVKVYPNPSSTQVIIDNGNYSTMGSYTAKIVNTAGQQVFQSVINQQQFVIDAKTMGGAGVYTLYITDALNKVVGVKKIVLQ